MGFQQTNSNPCIYRASDEEERFLIAIYVNDIILAGKSDEKMKAIKKMLSARFEVKDICLPHHFLGVKVLQDQAKRSVWIGQPTYINTLLERFGMENSKPVKTSVYCGSRLVKARDSDKAVDQTFQSAVRCLLYLSTGLNWT